MDTINNPGGNRSSTVGGNKFLLGIGWVAAILSLVFYPFVFGVIGVIMGILSTKNKNRTGLSLIVASIILMGIGLVFSGVIRNYLFHYLGWA